MRDNIIDAYINEIIEEIHRVESLKKQSARMDQKLLRLWIDEIVTTCEDFYEDYLMGKREHFYMSIEEYEQVFDEAGIKYCEQILDSLIDEDLVVAEINKEGDILYKENKK